LIFSGSKFSLWLSRKILYEGLISKQWLEGETNAKVFRRFIGSVLAIVTVYWLIMTFVEKPETQTCRIARLERG